MSCKRCNGTGRISEDDDPFDAGTPAGDGQLICPQCDGRTMKIGKQYRLVIPASFATSFSASGWPLAIVTLVEIFVNPCPDPNGPHAVCDCEGCRMGPYIAWVTSPGLKTSFAGNIFRAIPEWLQELNPKIPCDCPLNLMLSQGCQNQNHI